MADIPISIFNNSAFLQKIHKDLDGDGTNETWESNAINGITNKQGDLYGTRLALLNIADFNNDEKLEKEEYDLVKPYLNYDGKGEVTLSDLKALSTLASEKKGTDNKWDTAEQKSFLNSLSIKSIFSTIL